MNISYLFQPQLDEISFDLEATIFNQYWWGLKQPQIGFMGKLALPIPAFFLQSIYLSLSFPTPPSPTPPPLWLPTSSLPPPHNCSAIPFLPPISHSRSDPHHHSMSLCHPLATIVHIMWTVWTNMKIFDNCAICHTYRVFFSLGLP